MREAINFTFNGISSEDMGVHISNTSGGLFEDIFLPTRKIVETVTPYSDIPHFHKVEYEPLSFPLAFFIHEWQERDNLRQITRWLSQDYYKPMTFESSPDKVIYVMVEGASKLMHNGAKQGYIDLNIRCNSPYVYSTVQTDNLEVRGIVGNQLTIHNEGDKTIKPKVWITKKTVKGEVLIENKTTNQIARLQNIEKEEEVYINFANEDVISSYESTGVYRFDDFNNEWLELSYEEDNILVVTGDCDIKIEYQLIYQNI